MKKLILIALVALAGCAQVVPVPFNGPSGKQAYSMKCSGGGRSMDVCFQKAGELCPTGYFIIERSNAIEGAAVNGYASLSTRQALAVECK